MRASLGWNGLAALLSTFAGLRVISSRDVGTAVVQPSRALLLVTALCLAAGMMLLLRESCDPKHSGSAGSHIPTYSLEIRRSDPSSGHDAPYVSTQTEHNERPVELSVDESVSFDPRAKERVTGPVALRGFVLRNGIVSPWAAQLVLSFSGTFRLRAPVVELPDLLPGESDLVFVIGRPQTLFGSSLEDVVSGQRPLPDGLQLLRATLCILASPKAGMGSERKDAAQFHATQAEHEIGVPKVITQ